MVIRIGTAGWGIPRHVVDKFPTDGSSLERYAARFCAAEINSSFHRTHQRQTWERWHDSVPEHFRFSVKLPKEITHLRKLLDCSHELESFGQQVATLRDKLGAVLVQLPPKLAFDVAVAREFLKRLRESSPAAIVFEPRHISWFAPEADDCLEHLNVARVAADPSICPAAASPGGWRGISYWRLHGSPIMYRSSYEGRLESYAEQLTSARAQSEEVWCIFDNTASSLGTSDALALLQLENPGFRPHCR